MTKKTDNPRGAGVSDSPFAVLENLSFPDRPAATQASSDAPPLVKVRGPARAVVRLERKHRRGKEVTIIAKLGLPPKQLDEWCRELKRTLGCGGTVDAADDGTGVIVLQGDFRHRLEGPLVKLGVNRVTISG